MKSLKNIKATCTGNVVTITAEIEERKFGFPSQQSTVLHLADTDPKWARHVQISNEAFFVKRLGLGVAVPLEEWVTQVANVIEPKLSHPPKLKQGGKPLTVEFSSELEPQLQWQLADKPDAEPDEWQNIEGATKKTLTPNALPKGKYVRCHASSEAGFTFTPPTQIK